MSNICRIDEFLWSTLREDRDISLDVFDIVICCIDNYINNNWRKKFLEHLKFCKILKKRIRSFELQIKWWYIRRKFWKVVDIEFNCFRKRISCDRFQDSFLHRTNVFLCDFGIINYRRCVLLFSNDTSFSYVMKLAWHHTEDRAVGNILLKKLR